MELTEAERRLVDATKKGEVADCSSQVPEENDAAKGETWGDARTINADTIYQLATQRNPEWALHAKGIQVRAARIEGQLDFGWSEIKCPLVLIGCYLDETIVLTDASTRSIALTGTHLPGVQAEYLSVHGSLYLDEGFNAKGEVILRGAEIDDQLFCTRGTFENGLRADGLSAGVIFLNEGFNTKSVVSLAGAKIGDQLVCTRGTFENGLDAFSLKVGGIAFNEGFNVKGVVNLVGAKIDGQLLCVGGTFEGGLIADFLKVGTVFLGYGFAAGGVVSLLGAEIDGQLLCAGGTFQKGLIVDSLKVGSVFLNEGFSANGVVRLVGAQIDGQLVCTRGTFETGLIVDSLKVGDLFLNEGFKAKGEVSLEGAEISGELDCSGGTFEGNLDLRRAHAGALADDAKSWPASGKLLLDGFEYGISSNPSVPRDARSRLNWIELGPKEHFLPQPYEQLVKVLRAMGDDAGARKVSIRELWLLRKRGKIGFAAWLWNWLLYLTVGYGYRAWLALPWAVAVIILGGFIFQPARFLLTADSKVTAVATAAAAAPQKRIAQDADPQKPPVQIAAPQMTPAQIANSRLPDPFLYSVDVFVPFADLNQKKTWHLDEKGQYFRAYVLWYLFEELAGWVLSGLLAAAATGLLKSQ